MPNSSSRAGLVRRGAGPLPFHVERVPPVPELADVVEHYWLATWSLGSRTVEQEVVASPAVSAVVDDGPNAQSGVTGPVTGVFVRRLTGRGRAFGIRFRPAGISAVVRAPVWKLTNRRLSFVRVFGRRFASYDAAQRRERRLAALVDRANGVLVACEPRLSDEARRAQFAVDRAAASDVRTTAALARALAMSERTLQRLFREYVGVTPKWTIRRHRFQGALARLESGDPVDLTRLAAELGYFDHAHFAHEFRRTMGCSPSAFRRGVGRESGEGP